MVSAPAIFILGVSALPLAQRLKAVTGSEIHGPDGIAGTDRSYAKATTHLQLLFREGHAIIGLCASGILIRAIAPVLKDKRDEPPVIAVAEDGSSIVPLLGGHHGANELARRIQAAIGGHAAITTASDLRFNGALDEPPAGYLLANPEDTKHFAARVLAGEGVEVKGAMPGLPSFPGPAKGSSGLRLTVSESAGAPSPDHLVYHPRTLAVGIGCERGCSVEEVQSLIDATLAKARLAPESVACFASIDLKMDEPAIGGARLPGASARSCELRFFPAAELNAEAHRLKNPSERVMKEVGCPGVAEGAALAAAGPDSELIVEKSRSARATIAVARAPAPILAMRGTARGTVSVIGLGPGDKITRSPEATIALQQSTDWVGYGLYLDLAADALHGQAEHRFPLGAEEARVRHAIALAKVGKQVALICSGDPGIYAMAALVCEIIDLEPCRVAIDVIPGISAFRRQRRAPGR